MALDDILFDTQTAISEGASQYGFKVDEDLGFLTLTPMAKELGFNSEHTKQLNKLIKELLSLAFDLAWRGHEGIGLLNKGEELMVDGVRRSADELTDEERYKAAKIIRTSDGRVLKSRHEKRSE